MHILFCNFEYPPLGGGGGVVNAWLAEALAVRHEVTVLTSRGLGLPAASEERGVRIVRVPVFFRGAHSHANMASMAAYLPMGAWHGRRLLRAAPVDVVNTHFVVPSGPVGAGLARRAGCPHVISVHGGDLYDPSKRSSPHRHALLRAAIRRLLRRADAVVGQSRNTLENMRRYYTPELAAERIPLGIPRPPDGPPADRGTLGCDANDLLLVTVGRLVARKGLPQLVGALARLPARVRLLIVGDGPEAPALRRRAEELGVSSRIRFLGHVDEAQKFAALRAADLFVSTSRHEGFGLVFLEGMACGLPVVTYDHGGQTDFLTDGETGYLVPLDDETTFAARVEALAADEAGRRTMGENSRRRVEALYIDRCAAAYEALFERLLPGRTEAA